MPREKENVERRPSYSVLALFCFAASFMIARIFTTFYPGVSLIAGGFHIHHFWYGLAMVAIGGWLGINYRDDRTDRLAAIIYGAGGGLIGDEVGLLLTFGDYRTEMTYTIVIMFLTFASTIILLRKYSKIIRREFGSFTRRNISLYFGVFLAAVSVAFITETNDNVVITVSSITTLVALAIILTYLVQKFRS